MTKNQLARMTVLSTEQIAPSMCRVVVGGDGFDQVVQRHGGFADSYVKLAFLKDGFSYPKQIDLDEVRATMPQEAWPSLRTYTIRRLDIDRRELWIDFVTHGAEGLAGPWAQQAAPGDIIHLRGPGGAYRPLPDTDVHLFVGDEAALPAISVALESLDAGQRAVACIEVDGPEDELPVESAGDVRIHWLHRQPAPAGTTTLLDEAVRAWPWPEGRVQVFMHGESALLKTLRPYLVQERGTPRSHVSVSAYWRYGVTEEGFRVWKSEQPDDPVVRPVADSNG